MTTYAPGQIEVNTNRGTLCRLCGGFDGPNTCVNEKPTSRAMYVVAAKNAKTKKLKGCEGCVSHLTHAPCRPPLISVILATGCTGRVGTQPYTAEIEWDRARDADTHNEGAERAVFYDLRADDAGG